ncbi:radical SAM protein, partial [bacterium]|nr:radical SAM protein [bacterium]
PSSCVFCSNSIWGKKSYRMKSPLKFVDEIEFLYKKYGFKGFDFWDDTLTLSKNHILGICDEILRRELKIEWYARARVNTVNKEILLSMKRAGCVAIGYGIESGSPKVLEAIKKKITISQIKQAVKDTADIGIISKNFFMFSLPKEQEEDILMTINLMKELVSYSSTVTTPYALTLIYPGTELEKLAKSRGILSQNFSWNTYTEFSKSRLYGENKTIPFYEEQLSLEKVKSILRRNLVSKGDFFQKAKRRLSRIRNFHDILSSFKAFR